MRPTDRLRSEHRIIEIVLTYLDATTTRLASAQVVDLAELQSLIGFFRTFADGVHHGKEEALLFPMLEARGFHPERSPTGCMRREHDDGRLRLDGMQCALGRMNHDLLGGSRAFIAHANLYTAMLRQHIQKEDHCLFTMADQALSPEDQEVLRAQFEMVDERGHGEEVRRHWIAFATAISRKMGMELPGETGVSAGMAAAP